MDVRSEVITATETTAGDVNEAHVMIPLLESHQVNTGRGAEMVVADSKYGTIENFLACHDRGLKAPMPDLRRASVKRIEKLEIFSEGQFQYDRQSRDYAAPKKTCEACHLREQCTKNKSGRTIKRHLRQKELDKMREATHSAKARRDIKTRQHLMERSFARGARYGYDRARWRGLWQVQIQEYLIAAVENLDVFSGTERNPREGYLSR